LVIYNRRRVTAIPDLRTRWRQSDTSATHQTGCSGLSSFTDRCYVSLQTTDLPAPLTTLPPWLDMRLRPAKEVRHALDRQTHRRFIKTHTPLDGLPMADDVTYVVVGRDPRDVAVSMDHHRDNLDSDVIERLLTQTVRPGPAKGSTSAERPRRPQDRRQRLLQWIDNDDPPSSS
jgi:hypothetical protein